MDSPLSTIPRDRPAFSVTPAMVEAGVWEARGHPLGAPLTDLVRKVFIAMMVESSVCERLRPLDH